MQRLIQHLIHDILRSKTCDRSVVEEDLQTWKPLAINQVTRRIRIIKECPAEIYFSYPRYMRTRSECSLDDRGQVVDARNKSHLRIEIFLCHGVPRVHVEPVVGVRQPSAERRVVSLQSLRPRLRVITAQIQILKEQELRIEAEAPVIRVDRASRLLIHPDEPDIGSRHQWPLHAHDRII